MNSQYIVHIAVKSLMNNVTRTITKEWTIILRIAHGARCSSSDNGAWLGYWQEVKTKFMHCTSQTQIWFSFERYFGNVCYSFLLNDTSLVHLKPRQSYLEVQILKNKKAPPLNRCSSWITHSSILTEKLDKCIKHKFDNKQCRTCIYYRF